MAKEIYANVIIDISIDKLDRTFQYRIPEGLLKTASEGKRVKVPFGRWDTIREGYIYNITDSPACDLKKIKDIKEVVERAVTVKEKLLLLAAWMRQTYGSTMNQALKTVLPVKYLRKRKSAAKKPSLSFDEKIKRKELPMLAKEQNDVYEGIRNEWKENNRPSLIHGITGSGKTFIYMRLIDEMIRQGKQSILLIPEISLTWQTVNRFYACFGDKVAVFHSRLSKGERSDLTEKAEKGEVSLCIGPRSALFTPFPSLGLIIIDEEHETSYQSEVTPRYNAIETAVKRAEIENAHVVLGSATPSVESRYACEKGTFAYFRLNERYGQAFLPKITVADMREELKSGNRTILSCTLAEAIEERLERKEQTMLFLNRRGHTGFISCRSCGSVVKCPHCDVSLTLHKGNILMCHYCGYKEHMITKCKVCGSPYIGGFQAGTEQVEELVLKTFPKARVLRMDADTTKTKDSYEKILKKFAENKADILIGTQMIVKGHDFPNVTLVGILAADMSLYTSDYRSPERTFQLISQAVGRSGRGEKMGEAIIQTYSPDHFVITAAVAGDYDSFYNEEMNDREVLDYPPLGHMVSVHGSGSDEEYLRTAMEYLKKYAVSSVNSKKISVLGPTPEVISKVADVYKMVLYIRGKERADLIRVRKSLEKYIEINSGYDSILIQFNLDS